METIHPNDVKRQIAKHFDAPSAGVSPWRQDRTSRSISVSNDHVSIELRDHPGVTFADLEWLSELLGTKNISLRGDGNEVGSEMTPMTEGIIRISCSKCTKVKVVRA